MNPMVVNNGGGGQAGGFRPLTVYDAPGVVIQQLLDDELTVESLRDVVFNQNRLTPSERESLADTVIRKHGLQESTAGRAAVQVLLNPWVWLMVGMSAMPWGKVTGKAGSIFVQKAKPWLQEHAGPMHATGLATASQLFPEVMPAFHDTVTGTKNAIEQQMAGRLGKALEPFFAKVSQVAGRTVTSLDDLPEDLDRAMAMRAAGADTVEGLTAYVPRGKTTYAYRKVGEDAWTTVQEAPAGIYDDQATKAKWEFLKKTEEALARNEGREVRLEFASPVTEVGSGWKTTSRWQDPRLVDEVLERYGKGEVEAVMRAVDAEQRHKMMKLLGDEGHWAKTAQETGRGEFLVDPRKAYRLFESGVTQPIANGQAKGLAGHEGMELLWGMGQGPETLRAMREGKLLDKETWVANLKKLYEPAMNRKGRYLPLNNTDVAEVAGVQLDRDQIQMAREKAWVGGVEGRVVPATSDRVLLHQEEIRKMRTTAGPGERAVLDAMEAEVTAEAQKAMAQGRALMVHRFSYGKQVRKGLNQLTNTLVWHGQGIGDDLAGGFEEMQKSFGEKQKLHAWGRNPVSGKSVQLGARLSEVHPDATPGMFGKMSEDVTPMMLLQRVHDVTEDPSLRRTVREVLPDAISDTGRTSSVMTKLAQIQTQRMAGWFADSGIGQLIRGAGPKASRFVDELKDYSTREVKSGLNLDADLAKYLYVTHLGLNVSSAMVNLLQPLMLVGPTVGYGALAKGYARAVGEMVEYAGKRAAQGFRPLSELEGDKLIGETFSHAGKTTGGKDLIGITGGTLRKLDSTMAVEELTRRKGKVGLAFEYAMKMFEKSEQLVRATAGHAVEAWYGEQGLSKVGGAFKRDVERMVLESAYGASGINTPMVFLKNPVFGHPLVRQFMSFPVRSFVGVFAESPTWGNRGYAEGLARNVLMGMGASAVVYELGRELVGANLSRGLFASGSTDILGLNKIDQGETGPIPTPPVLDIPFDFLRGLAGGDKDLMRDAVMRLVPGGIAANRFLGVLPDLGQTWAGEAGSFMQRTSAGWGQPLPDGTVPVFKGGRLVEYKKPSALVYRALGVDLGATNDTGELDGYLVKQRDQIAGYRQRLLMALRGNDIGKAQAIRAEFERRFKDPVTGKGLPLTVNQAQMTAFLRGTDTPRTERVLDRIGPEYRAVYGRMVAGGGQLGTNVPMAAVAEGGSARQRDELRPSRARASQDLTKAAMQAQVPGSTQESGQAYEAPRGY